MDKWIKENKITTVIVIVLAVIYGLGYFGKGPIKTEETPHKIATISDIDLQTKCSAQAKSFFEYFVTDSKERQTAEYSNHYNVKLNKCFFLIKNQGSDGTFTKDFFDAIEKVEYGSFASNVLKPINEGKTGLIYCTMNIDGDQHNTKSCKSEEEFDTFVDTYMKN